MGTNCFFFFNYFLIVWLSFQIHNGATFVKVDKIDIMKDNSPALLFQGMASICLLVATVIMFSGFMHVVK